MRQLERCPIPQALAQSPSLCLQKIKEVKAKFPDATINDVLMAVVCLTIQAYFGLYEPSVIEKRSQVRANFPINLRRNGEDLTNEEHFGNRVAAGFLTFPLHIKDPCDLLWRPRFSFAESSRRTHRCKKASHTQLVPVPSTITAPHQWRWKACSRSASKA